MQAARILVSILFLKSGPQDLPYSRFLLQALIFLYVITGAAVLSSSVQDGMGAANVILDVLVTLFYTYMVLSVLDRKPRFIQTASAMVGVGVPFHLIAWPVLMQQNVVEGEQTLTVHASLVMLLLLSWNLLVVAHIFKQALESRMTNAILLSFALFFVSMALSRFLLGS